VRVRVKVRVKVRVRVRARPERPGPNGHCPPELEACVLLPQT
jgi:hypothetical protein